MFLPRLCLQPGDDTLWSKLGGYLLLTGGSTLPDTSDNVLDNVLQVLQMERGEKEIGGGDYSDNNNKDKGDCNRDCKVGQLLDRCQGHSALVPAQQLSMVGVSRPKQPTQQEDSTRLSLYK